MEPLNPLDAVQKVHEMHQSMWKHTRWFLGIVGALLLGVFGYLVPHLTVDAQERTLKAEIAQMKVEMKSQVADMKTQVRQEIATAVEAVLKESMAQSATSIYSLEGGVQHVQGRLSLKENNFVEAGNCWVRATESYIVARDEVNLRRVVTGFLLCLPNINKAELEQSGLGDKVQKVLKDLRSYDTDKRYYDLCNEVEKALKDVQERSGK